MEPCSKRLSGKKSCSTRCIEHGVKRIIVGVLEPSHFVNCEGVGLLKAQGIDVVKVEGFEEECLAPNRHVLDKTKN